MFSPKTVFIVGAGASKEVGLPLGAGLKARVRELVHFEPNHGFRNREVAQAVAAVSGTNQHRFNGFYNAALTIMQGLEHVGSIDTFLDIHQYSLEVVTLGKIAICVAILEDEQKSALYYRFLTRPHTQDVESYARKLYDGSWYVPFGELLTQGIAYDQVGSIYDNISIITFNYDRCIELFAEHLLRSAYGLGDAAKEVAGRLEVLHVYGQIGTLYPTQNGPDVPFGRIEGANYAELSRGIKTFTETVDSDIGERIRSRVSDADTLVFLGFGWLPQNLNLLQSLQTKVRRVFFTSCGIHEPDRETVLADLSRVFDKRVAPDAVRAARAFEERGGCVDLFRRHWRQLTRS